MNGNNGEVVPIKIKRKEFYSMAKRGIHIDKNDANGYRVRCGYAYRLHRRDINGEPAYGIKVKNYAGQTAFKKVLFAKSNTKNKDIEDGTLIRPLRLAETFYISPKTNQPIFAIVLLDWQEILTEEQKERRFKAKALEKYQRQKDFRDLDLDNLQEYSTPLPKKEEQE